MDIVVAVWMLLCILVSIIELRNIQANLKGNKRKCIRKYTTTLLRCPNFRAAYACGPILTFVGVAFAMFVLASSPNSLSTYSLAALFISRRVIWLHIEANRAFYDKRIVQ